MIRTDRLAFIGHRFKSRPSTLRAHASRRIGFSETGGCHSVLRGYTTPVGDVRDELTAITERPHVVVLDEADDIYRTKLLE